MTTIRDVNAVCHICNTKYSGKQVGSWYSGLPKPEIKPLKCPGCGAPYRPGVKPHVGMAKEILQNLLESKEKAVGNLFQYSRTKNDLTEWVDYIRAYASPDNFKEWLEFEEKFVRNTWNGIQTQQKGKPGASQTPEEEIEKQQEKARKVEEMFNSGNLPNLLDEIKKEVEAKLDEELGKYAPKNDEGAPS